MATMNGTLGARRLLVAALAVAILLLAQTDSAWAQVQSLDGTLAIVWGDPHPVLGTASAMRFELIADDGTVTTLRPGELEAVAVQNFGRRVTVTGRAEDQAAAAAGQSNQVFIVETLVAAATTATITPAAVIGTRKVIYLLVRFSDDANVPHPPSFYLNMNNPDTPPPGTPVPATLNGFFKKTSHGQFSWIGDVGGTGGIGAPGGWLTLPNPKSHYAPCGWSSVCSNLSALFDDALTLGRAQGIAFSGYDNINLVLSNDLDCCAWGGSRFSAIEGKSFGVTWEPPWGQEPDVYAHEMGHSLGLPHSGWVYYAYDSPWDVMSRSQIINSMTCGSYLSKNDGVIRSIFCREPGAGYNAAYKEFLGWIPPGNLLTINATAGATVSLEASALPMTSAIRMIKICLTGFACSGTSARYVTVEARVKGLGTVSQFDNGIPGEGVVIHEVQRNRPPIGGSCFFNSQSGWAVPVDATPGDYDSVACNSGGRPFPNWGLFNAQWNPGQTYVNATSGVRVSVLSRSGSSFVVSVGPNAPTITGQPMSRTVGYGETTTLSVTAVNAAGYQWYRGASGSIAAPLTGATSAAYTTPPSTATTRYWVRVFSPSGGSSDSSAATVTVAFADDPLDAGAAVRALHVAELRLRIDALRIRFGLGAFSWTDVTPSPGTTIKAIHIAELRSALQQAHSAAGVPAPVFTDPTLVAGVTLVRRLHFTELRAAVHALESL